MPNAQTDKFFERWAEEGLMVTYGDLLLKPRFSAIMADASVVSLTSRFSRHTELKVPVVSAAMDTVTEAAMAIAMAKCGGLGTIHRAMTPDEQAKQVARVKHYMQAFIAAPITVCAGDTVASLHALRLEKGYEFESFPVLDDQGKLVGLVTGNDLDDPESHDKLGKIMLPLAKLIVGDPRMKKTQALERMREGRVKVIPLVDADGRLAGMYSRKDLLRARKGSSMHNVDGEGRLRVAAAVGVGSGEFERALLLAEKGCDALVIDMAHGHTPEVADMTRRLKAAKIESDVVAGNVSIAEAAVFLAEAGVDGIRVGQGGGSICITRVVAGMGVSQGTAVYECAKALRRRNVPVCADGGITLSRDIVLAIALGAESVTVGSLLAGTDEAPGDVSWEKGQRVKSYRGMGSLDVMKKRATKRYSEQDILVPEGVAGAVSYKGALETVLGQYMGGLRTGMAYQGARTLAELCENACVQRVTPAGNTESHPHDLVVIKETPNYTGQGR